MSNPAMNSILEFLRSRNIPDAEQICQHMDLNKVDISVLSTFNEDNFQLNEWLPKHEDRIALISWSKQIQTKEINLLDDLPDNALNNSCEQQHCETEEDGSDESLMKKTPRNKLNSIRVQLSWLHFDLQNGYELVSEIHGGGMKEIECLSEFKLSNLLEVSKVLFFNKDSMSINGRWSELDSTIVDLVHDSIDNYQTVHDLYDSHGRFGILRCYLVTRNKGLDAIDLKTFYDSENLFNPSSSTLNTILDHKVETDIDGVVQGSVQGASSTSDILDTVSPRRYFREFCQNHYLSDEDGSQYSQYRNFCLDEVLQNSGIIEDGDSQYFQHPGKNKFIFHRGQVFEEMIQRFKYINLSELRDVSIELLHPNGYPEQGIDTGGVLRDTLSEFWTTMYETCTTGTDIKIPFLSHNFKEDKWRSIAKIFVMGWINSKYLPIKLALPFVEQIFFDEVTSELVPPFLQTLSIDDRDVLLSAKSDFSSVEKEDLITILSNLECRVIPNERNFKKILREIAHKELIQKPYFIIKQFQKELKRFNKSLFETLSKEKLYSLYETMEPTTDNILNMLTVKYNSSSKLEIITYGFLLKFISATTDDLRAKFVRFCTGADVITDLRIVVKFLDQMLGANYAPIVHTCSCTLQLPLLYLNYDHFEKEMVCILTSNFWSMNTP